MNSRYAIVKSTELSVEESGDLLQKAAARLFDTQRIAEGIKRLKQQKIK